MAGIDIPQYAQGYDLCRWMEDREVSKLRETVFAQVGNYHGFLKTTFPTGMPATGRHPGLLTSARTKDFSYIHDPDYGDEAYDLREDPWELCNILQGNEAPSEVAELREAMREWDLQCKEIKSRLNIVSGDRGFVEGWE